MKQGSGDTIQGGVKRGRNQFRGNETGTQGMESKLERD